MGLFDVIGNAMKSVQHVGSKFLHSIGTVGSKVAGIGQDILNFAGNLPFVGGAIKANPLYGLGQTVVTGVKAGSQLAKGAGDILERGTRPSKGEFHDLYRDAMTGRRAFDHIRSYGN